MTATGGADSQTDLLAGTLHGKPRAALRALVLPILRHGIALRIVGESNVPLTGRLLVVSNHVSNADPPILEAVFPRPLFFMGKAELFRIPVLGWLVRKFGGFPVVRGTADRAALRHALAALRQGVAVGVFPEGGRSRTGALVAPHPGVGLLALQSGAPVLPVAITGTEYFPVNGETPPRRPAREPRQVIVRIGTPFQIPRAVDGRRVTAEEATRLMMVHVAALLPERYRGVFCDYV